MPFLRLFQIACAARRRLSRSCARDMRLRLVLGLAVARAVTAEEHEGHGRRPHGVPRVACAVVGETRTLPLTVGSLLRNVVRPLHADVFLQISAESTLKAAANFSLPSALSAQQMDQLRLALRPVRYSVRHVATLAQRWKVAFEAIEAYEGAAGWRYDWVVRVRPDVVHGCAMSLEFLHMLAHRVWMYWDFAAVLPRRVAASAFKRAANPECGAGLESHTIYGPGTGMEFCEPLRTKNAAEEAWSPVSNDDAPSVYRHARCEGGMAHFSGTRASARDWCHGDEQQRVLNSTRPACGAIRKTNLRADWVVCCKPAHSVK